MTGFSKCWWCPPITISKQTPSFVTPASFAVTACLWETTSMLSAPTVTPGNEPRSALKFNKKWMNGVFLGTKWLKEVLAGALKWKDRWGMRQKRKEKRKTKLYIWIHYCVLNQWRIRKTKNSWLLEKNGSTDQLAGHLKLSTFIFIIFLSVFSGHWAYIHCTNTHSSTICLSMCVCVCMCRDSRIDLFLPSLDTITLMLWMRDKHSRHATCRGCWQIIKRWKRNCRIPSSFPCLF